MPQQKNYIPDQGDLIWIEFNPQAGQAKFVSKAPIEIVREVVEKIHTIISIKF